jgi:aminoglycoside phosphotransferase (APT) family kinase protein
VTPSGADPEGRPSLSLIAQGRTADVYALDEGRVLRRYRRGGPTRREARLMAYLATQGYPVPRVYDVTDTDLVMERLSGPTMLEAVQRSPWRLFTYGRLLAGLHDDLHAIAAPDWLPERFPGDSPPRVLHLDLHPGNVILTPSGPAVIDWCNGAAGDPAADVAQTLVIVGSSDATSLTARLGRSAFLRVFRARCLADPAPRTTEVATARLTDPNITEAEARRLKALIASGSRR